MDWGQLSLFGLSRFFPAIVSSVVTPGHCAATVPFSGGRVIASYCLTWLSETALKQGPGKEVNSTMTLLHEPLFDIVVLR